MGFEAIPNRGLRTWERYREEVREEWRCAGETLFAAGRTSRDEEVADIGEALEVATNQVARLTCERDDAQKLVGEQRELLLSMRAERDDLRVEVASLGQQLAAEREARALEATATRQRIAHLESVCDDYARQIDAHRRARGDGDPGVGA